jgi:hypothetical protein
VLVPRKSAEVAADILEEFENEVGDDVWVAAHHLRDALAPTESRNDQA